MPNILGFSGKKQSGKTTACNYLFGREMGNIGIFDKFNIDDKGRLWVPVLDEESGEIQSGCIDPCSSDPEVQDFFATNVWPFCKIYQLAEPLKWICSEVMNLGHDMVNGTNEQKEQLTQYKWEDMPSAKDMIKPIAKTGPMSAREIMQYVGTDIFRRMYPNIWTDYTIRMIKKQGSNLAIVSDCRFPDEVEGIQEAGGKVIRFLRDPFEGTDRHASETALDDYPHDKFDAVIENQNMSIEEQNAVIRQLLLDWDYIKIVED